MSLDYWEEALKQRAEGDTLCGLAVTTDDIGRKADLADLASRHYAIAARFEELHFHQLTGEQPQ
ncbi:hypothetical protein [Microbacterium aurum]|jgi:hypothetical protein